MSFLDNLENDLKALESQQENDPEKLRREQEARAAEKAAALKAAPHADALKHSQFTQDFLTACRTIGHGQRTLVRFTWVGNTLRLEAKQKKLDLNPTPDGIEAVFFEDDQEKGRQPVDLNGDPHELAARWLQ